MTRSGSRPRPRPQGGQNDHDLLIRERNFLSALLETTSALVMVFDPQGRILRLNRAMEELGGYSILDLVGQPFWEAFPVKEESAAVRVVLEKILASRHPQEYQGWLRTRQGRQRLVVWTMTCLNDTQGQPEYILVTGIDVTALQEARAEAKVLSGLLPICASCKRIRDDRGYWNQIEEYIRSHSQAEFTHGLCPDCRKKLADQHHGDRSTKDRQ